MLKFLFKDELKQQPKAIDFSQLGDNQVKDRTTWSISLGVLGFMVILFIFHHLFHWEAWMVATIGLTLILFLAPKVDMDGAFGTIEITLLAFLYPSL